MTTPKPRAHSLPRPAILLSRWSILRPRIGRLCEGASAQAASAAIG
jgi:hypothetical protein